MSLFFVYFIFQIKHLKIPSIPIILTDLLSTGVFLMKTMQYSKIPSTLSFIVAVTIQMNEE